MTETPHDTTGPGGQGPRVSNEQMRDLNRLRRSTTDRHIAGVAGGIGRHLDIDPTVVRVLLVVLAFFGGAGLLVYGAVWLLVPEDGSDQAPIHVGGETRSVALIVALVVAALLLLSDGWWFGFNEGWPPPLLPLAVVGLLVWLLVRGRNERRRRGATPAAYEVPPGYGGPTPPAGSAPYQQPYQPPVQEPYQPPVQEPYQPPHAAPRPRDPRGRSLFGITLAVALLVLGAVAAVELAGAALPWAVYPAAALTVVGVALVTGGFLGRATGLTFLGVLAAAVLAVAVWSPALRLGDVVRHPTTAAQLRDSYSYTAGRIHLDLTGISDLENLDGRVLDLDMLAGDVVVELPADGLDVDVVSEARGGQLVVLGHVAEGPRIINNRSTPDTSAPDLRIDLDLGYGHARVSTP